MHRFAELYDRAVERKGSAKALEALIPKPKTAAALTRISDDRWLSQMTKNIFRAGFVWRVVDAKWDAFEALFQKFDLQAVAYLSAEQLHALGNDKRIIRHHAKLGAARDNAVFMLDLVAEHGSVGKFFSAWPSTDYVALLEVLRKRASRMGGMSAQYFLREVGKDAFLLTRDVNRVLVAEGVVDKAPSSKRDFAAVQDAFNGWCEESGRGLTAVSRVLAMSVE